MRPVGDVCKEVLASIDGAMLRSLLDLETGVELGIIEPMSAAAANQLADEVPSDGAEVDVPGGPEARPPTRS